MESPIQAISAQARYVSHWGQTLAEKLEIPVLRIFVSPTGPNFPRS